MVVVVALKPFNRTSWFPFQPQQRDCSVCLSFHSQPLSLSLLFVHFNVCISHTIPMSVSMFTLLILSFGMMFPSYLSAPLSFSLCWMMNLSFRFHFRLLLYLSLSLSISHTLPKFVCLNECLRLNHVNWFLSTMYQWWCLLPLSLCSSFYVPFNVYFYSFCQTHITILLTICSQAYPLVGTITSLSTSSITPSYRVSLRKRERVWIENRAFINREDYYYCYCDRFEGSQNS